jgi:nickel/cobalt exporter
MTALGNILQQTGAYGWLYMPSAVVLGALHGLEPGHSKTMMAAYIVAIRGTTRQAVLLGVAATVSHTLIVWIVALAGLKLGSRWNSAAIEPWLQLLSATIISGIAVWMIWRTQRSARRHHDHDHDHDHDHEHHADEHEREHALELQRQLSSGPVSNSRILMFGLTGGLIPCPASITVLMVCLQLKQLALGAMLVLCFSIGLALTLITSGVLASYAARHATRRWSGLADLAERAPQLSGALMLLVGLYMATLGWRGLLNA